MKRGKMKKEFSYRKTEAGRKKLLEERGKEVRKAAKELEKRDVWWRVRKWCYKKRGVPPETINAWEKRAKEGEPVLIVKNLAGVGPPFEILTRKELKRVDRAGKKFAKQEMKKERRGRGKKGY